ncbi:hypothetical protein D9M71_452800 [compost metagenome]
MLRSTAQRRGGFLAVADQVAALAAFIQPPGDHARPAGAPQRQAGAAQGGVGGVLVEADHQRQRRAVFVAVLADQLLRVLEIAGERRILDGLLVAGQAHHQGLQGAGQAGVAFFRLLRGDRLVDLVEVADGFGEGWQAEQRQAEDQQAGDGSHGGLSADDREDDPRFERPKPDKFQRKPPTRPIP